MADTSTATPKSKLPPGVHGDGSIDWPLSFPLRQPIRAFDDEYSAIELKAPSAKDIIKHGLLLKGMSEENSSAIISDLSGIPVGSVERMDGADFMKLTAVLARFFQQAGE